MLWMRNVVSLLFRGLSRLARVPELAPCAPQTRRTPSASTVSEKSMGLITPRSEGDETPHPLVLRQPQDLTLVAAQLAELREAQQRLVERLPQQDFHRPRAKATAYKMLDASRC